MTRWITHYLTIIDKCDYLQLFFLNNILTDLPRIYKKGHKNYMQNKNNNVGFYIYLFSFTDVLYFFVGLLLSI